MSYMKCIKGSNKPSAHILAVQVHSNRQVLTGDNRQTRRIAQKLSRDKSGSRRAVATSFNWAK